MREMTKQDRINLCKYCIEVLEKEKDDPRQPEALEFYKAQLVNLESKLPKPPDIVIGLKTATLLGQVPTLGG
jgi:hypothetical protein